MKWKKKILRAQTLPWKKQHIYLLLCWVKKIIPKLPFLFVYVDKQFVISYFCLFQGLRLEGFGDILSCSSSSQHIRANVCCFLLLYHPPHSATVWAATLKTFVQAKTVIFALTQMNAYNQPYQRLDVSSGFKEGSIQTSHLDVWTLPLLIGCKISWLLELYWLHYPLYRGLKTRRSLLLSTVNDRDNNYPAPRLLAQTARWFLQNVSPSFIPIVSPWALLEFIQKIWNNPSLASSNVKIYQRSNPSLLLRVML